MDYTLCFRCRGQGIDPWLGNMPCGAARPHPQKNVINVICPFYGLCVLEFILGYNFNVTS